MTGAIYYSSKQGSTAQYANWIAEETDLPVFDVDDTFADPSSFDFVILGSPVIVGKLTIRKWVQSHLPSLLTTPVILFTVSAAGAGEKLDGWIANSLPESLNAHLAHVALRGRMNLDELGWLTRLTLKIGARMTRDPEERKSFEGFDYMVKSSVEPVVNLVRQYQAHEAKPGLQKSPDHAAT